MRDLVLFIRSAYLVVVEWGDPGLSPSTYAEIKPVAVQIVEVHLVSLETRLKQLLLHIVNPTIREEAPVGGDSDQGFLARLHEGDGAVREWVEVADILAGDV